MSFMWNLSNGRMCMVHRLGMSQLGSGRGLLKPVECVELI